MTEITDAVAAEILWARSEQGKAAVRAAWDKAEVLDHCTQRTAASPPWSGTSTDQVSLDTTDVSAVVYAAYLAAGWDGGPEEGADGACQHTWTILGAQEVPPVMAFASKPMPRTAVLTRCTNCGELATRVLEGTWTMETFMQVDGA